MALARVAPEAPDVVQVEQAVQGRNTGEVHVALENALRERLRPRVRRTVGEGGGQIRARGFADDRQAVGIGPILGAIVEHPLERSHRILERLRVGMHRAEPVIDVEDLVALRRQDVGHDPVGVLGHHRECPTVDVDDRRQASDSVPWPVDVQQVGTLAGIPIGDVVLDVNAAPTLNDPRQHAIPEPRKVVRGLVHTVANQRHDRIAGTGHASTIGDDSDYEKKPSFLSAPP